ncbi:hypothetical protein JVU11DRAFT_850 [Chiua virens]|nr:hypothetical protein JVU11DRAFT_850 [Chiua virens]
MSPKQSLSDVHETHQITALEVTASSPDASSFSSTGSPRLLIPEASDVRSSLGSSHDTPTVKFAPLPQIDPNRKRCLAPLGVSRTRRKQAIEEGDLEDPIIAFAKLVKKTSKSLWRRVKGSKHAIPGSVSYSDDPVLDIKSAHCPSDVAQGEKSLCVSSSLTGREGEGKRPASWSPPDERRTFSEDEAKRRSTGDLPRLLMKLAGVSNKNAVPIPFPTNLPFGMACTPTPTATLYGVFTSFVPSTSYSLSGDSQPQVTTIVQQSCVASGTISGSSVGCVSSVQVAQVNTVGGGGQTAQVPIVVTVPVTESQPTQTLFAPCTSGDSSSSPPAPSTQASTPTPVTTSYGSVEETIITLISTQPPTAVYVPTTSLASPSLQNNATQGNRGIPMVAMSQAPITFPHVENATLSSLSSVEPRPYQYGLVGHVIPPAAAGETLRSSHYGSVSEHSGTHSRNTSYSATPLLQGTRTKSSRPSTAGSILTGQTQPGSRVLSGASDIETQPRSLSVISTSNITVPDGQSTPTLLNNWTPNTDDLGGLEPLHRTGSPAPAAERRILQIVNDSPPSPTDTVAGARRTSGGPSSPSVIMHTDGGRVPEGTLVGLDENPPAYSR